MRHLIKLFIVSQISFAFAFAQTPEWITAISAGGEDADEGLAMVTDESGYTYVTGHFYQTATFGSITLNSSLYRELFVAKADQDGNWMWAVCAGGMNHSQGSAIVMAPDTYLYITGTLNGTGNFGGHAFTSNAYSEDIFVAKISPSGIWQWARGAGGPGIDHGNGITVDAAGNPYVTGQFAGTATFGGVERSSSGPTDILVLKYDTDGNLLWSAQGGGEVNDDGNAVAVNSNGDCYVTGYFQGTAWFGSQGLISSGGADVFVASITPDGTWNMARRGGGADTDEATAIDVDAAGNGYITGRSSGGAIFGGENYISGPYNHPFVAKIKPDGTFLWVQELLGDCYGCGHDITVGTDSKLRITGSYSGSAVMGPTSLTNENELGSETGFVAGLDRDGNWIWARQISGRCEAYGLATDPDANTWITGLFYDTAVFDSKSITSAGSRDIYLARLGQAGPLTPGFTADTLSGEAPLTVRFTDLSLGNPISWEWDFQNDGTIDSYVQNPVWTYSEPGLQTVKLTISDGEYTVTYLRADYISVGFEIIIPDDQFRNVINSALGQPTDYQPTIDDLHSISGSLIARDQNICSIEGAQHLINVTILYLSGNSISDLSPLSNLDQLIYLWADENRITDLSNIFNLPALSLLDVSDNYIEDISGLSAIPSLKSLYLTNNRIANISPLSDLQSLYCLWIENNLVSDLSALRALPLLTQAYLQGNRISDIAPLVDNSALGESDVLENILVLYDELMDYNNPLSHEALDVHATALASRNFTMLMLPPVANELAPCYPSPARDAENVPASAALKWQGNYNGASATHELWLGTSPDELIKIGSASATDDTLLSFQPTLQPDTDYWWRVRAASVTDTVWSGPWHFSTKSPILPPRADFTADITAGERPLPVNFADLSEGDIETWAWDFENDGTTDSDEQNPKWTYNDAGVYSVSLIVSNTAGADTAIFAEYISVEIPAVSLQADFTADVTTGERPLPVSFADLSEGDIETWAWDFENDGTIDSDEQNPKWTYNDAGVYSVSLIVSNTAGADTVVKTDFISVISQPDTIFVNKDGSGDATTIQAGIDKVQDGDIIIVHPGTYVENINFSGKNITVTSRYLTTKDTSYISRTIIDGNHRDAVVTMNTNETSLAVLSGFTITNGYSPGSGGGILIYGSSPVIADCKIIANEAVNYGGGIACLNDASAWLHHLRITDNTSQNGGGVDCFQSNILIEYAVLSENSASIGGGAVILSNCTDMRMNHVTIADNNAQYGPAVMLGNSQISLQNSIVWDNTSYPIYFNNYYDPNTLNVSHSDIQGGILSVLGENGSLNWGDGNLDADPQFIHPESGNYFLSATSPCLGSGAEGEFMGALGVGVIEPVALEDALLPNTFILQQNYPNPFNPTTLIQYGLPEQSTVRIFIYDISGRQIKTWRLVNQPAGWHGLVWDGSNNNCQKVSAGLYVYQMRAGAFMELKKMIFMK